MAEQPQASPIDVTMDADSSDTNRSNQHGRQMALVEGSTPHLSTETNDLLRRRLRSASLLLFSGFLAFFIRSLFNLDIGSALSTTR